MGDTQTSLEPSPSQTPPWPDAGEVDRVCAALRAEQGLVTPASIVALRERMADVALGRAFTMQAGECAETFAGISTSHVWSRIDVMRQATEAIASSGWPVVLVGRMAGQFAKPRSMAVEQRDGVALPVYRGDMINGLEFTRHARTPDPDRMIEAYRASAAVLAMTAAHSTPIPVAHEALVLDYERALTREVEGRRYALSGHLLWVGERTRQVDGPHVEHLATIDNPVAVKLGPTTQVDDVLRLQDVLDPDRTPGRLTWVPRLGASGVERALPGLILATVREGGVASWVCDPMHGNTRRLAGGRKTRRFADLVAEVRGFFAVHEALGTHPGGLHLEMSGRDVTECLGGPGPTEAAHLEDRYETACDPRLNPRQTVALAHEVSTLMPDRSPGA